MFAKKSNAAITLTLSLTVLLWGASNAGTRYLASAWPSGWLGATRLFFAGVILLAILRWTNWLGKTSPMAPAIKRQLWLNGGLTLALYIIVFNWALHLTSASHVALYLGMSPVWTLLWDDPPAWNRRSVLRYGAAALALGGIVILFWPALHAGRTGLLGEVFALTGSFLWAAYGVQGRALGKHLSGAQVSAHTMWRGGVILMPIALFEVCKTGLVWRADLVMVQSYCIIAGGVIAYALWNNALRHWPTSQVFLFNNLIPLSTTGWARICLGEPVTRTFWLAMILVMAGVVLGQASRRKIAESSWLPRE